ncbi:hypothetical protein R70006_06752 [Paraburkholderia domus]|uniref:Uncharacterized protein n=1 Tax=Paraburkholderia domus TaxID=2793075 RepID=A0A9N8N545_9BURK|nr:hypothetical protein R70006_06752 [Paraburkholderia domus]CAE6941363.1 hypothetical protein R75471_05376 [Paraburkholderia domus]CAE6953871.1 hypothetical protein R70211_06432 [Paraburkholderia domus]
MVHLESVPSHIQPWRQGSHTSGGATRADGHFTKPAATFSHSRFAHEFRDISARQGPSLPPRVTGAPGFPCRPIRDARSAEWALMNPLSLTPNVRGHRFQMHHYRNCAGDPLKNWRCELLSLAYFSLQQQREVGAAPHRGNANRPIRMQGKANAAGIQPNKAPRKNKPYTAITALFLSARCIK